MKTGFGLRLLWTFETCSIAMLCPSCAKNEKAQAGYHVEADRSELRRLKRADPTADAHEAIARKDFRFLAVLGYGLTVPGIPNYRDQFSARYKYRIIEGTTDFPTDDEDNRLQDIAIEYARSYNLVIRDYLMKEK